MKRTIPNKDVSNTARANYSMSKEDRLIMSKCLAFGIVCYSIPIDTRGKMLSLEVRFNRKVTRSKEPDFEEKYLTYKIIEVYKKFYEKFKDKM